MEALITSCGRFDLLNRTLESLYKDQKHPFFLTINEDGLTKNGQHASIEKFLQSAQGKYYLHCECDWEFNNSYDWISESIKIMERNPNVIKVLCRSDYVHPVTFNVDIENVKYGYLHPWEDPWKGHLWHGFGFNPGVTRLDLLKQLVPFGKTEQEVSKAVHDAGYKVVQLEKGVCQHIGENRSTHSN